MTVSQVPCRGLAQVWSALRLQAASLAGWKAARARRGITCGQDNLAVPFRNGLLTILRPFPGEAVDFGRPSRGTRLARPALTFSGRWKRLAPTRAGVLLA